MSTSRRDRRFLLVGLAICVVLAGGVSYYASANPDGLQKVAQEIGFGDSAQDHALDEGPLAGYGVKGVEDERTSVGVAGLIGVVVTAGLAFGLFRMLRRRDG